ncbi:MAG: hypothetical protein ACTH8F_09965 [Microbacterium sp.]|uniref:hypothetical protein n=1 Tax=Microbacterium sp. TaxID=51671 RepID=UPI003F967695
MISAREVAQRLDIPLEMAARHGLDGGMREEAVTALEQDPPAWLVQSRANRKKGARPVWVTLKCDVCGFTESARPKKWWPEFTYLSCRDHAPGELPAAGFDQHRTEIEGVGGRFIGIVDVTV